MIRWFPYVMQNFTYRKFLKTKLLSCFVFKLSPLLHYLLRVISCCCSCAAKLIYLTGSRTTLIFITIASHLLAMMVVVVVHLSAKSVSLTLCTEGNCKIKHQLPNVNRIGICVCLSVCLCVCVQTFWQDKTFLLSTLPSATAAPPSPRKGRLPVEGFCSSSTHRFQLQGKCPFLQVFSRFIATRLLAASSCLFCSHSLTLSHTHNAQNIQHSFLSFSLFLSQLCLVIRDHNCCCCSLFLSLLLL